MLAWPNLARTRQQFSVPLLSAVNSSIGFNLSVRGSRGCGLVSTAERQCHTGLNRILFRPLQGLYQLAGGACVESHAKGRSLRHAAGSRCYDADKLLTYGTPKTPANFQIRTRRRAFTIAATKGRRRSQAGALAFLRVSGPRAPVVHGMKCS